MAYSRYGGPEVLELCDRPEPKISQNGVLIRTKAAGLNPADYMLQEGLGETSYEAIFPVVPGWDTAGVVEAVGEGVTEFQPGDAVIGYIRESLLHNGTYAEKVAADVEMLVRKPENITWEMAAGLPLAGLTAYQAVIQTLRVRSDELVLIHGAAGGVGCLAAQLAKLAGARVIGTASETNHSYLRTLGVEPVAYGAGVADRVRALAPDGVDVLLDVAGQDVRDLVDVAMGEGWRAASVMAGMPGVTPVYARMNRRVLLELVKLVESGDLTIRVGRVYPLDRAAEAQQAQRQSPSVGKIVLSCP